MTTAAHLDDETISAVLDGQLAADAHDAARAHLDGCADCRARLAVFGDIAAAVGAPVAPPPDAAREAAVARALGAADPPVVRAMPGRRNWTPVLAVAAVLLALLVAVPLLGSVGSDDDADVAGGARDDTAALESGAGGGAAGDGYLLDLGVVDRDTLADAVATQLGTGRATLSAPAPAPAAAGGDAGAGAETFDAPAATADGEAVTTARARACAPRLDVEGEPELVARATYDGEPAAVLVYRDGDDVTAYVVDPAECSILQFVRFRARS